MLLALKNNLNSYLNNWLFQLRGPQAGPVVLNQRRVFILPTRQGLLFSVAAVAAHRFHQLQPEPGLRAYLSAGRYGHHFHAARFSQSGLA